MDDNDRQGIAATAARWHARLAAPDCSDGERAEFAAWLEAEPDHERAFRRVERFAMLAHALPEELIARPHPARAATAPAPRRAGGWRASLPLAACVAGLAVLTWIMGRTLPAERPAEIMANATMAGERIILADGSTMFLDAGSRVRVNVDDGRRQLEVLSGRALFEVVHDPSRPFTVRAGDSRTVALGTVFQVDYSSERVLVTLASGSVLVSSSSWKERLEPGFELSWRPAASAPRLRPVDAARVTAWTQGRHNFQDTPLRELVEVLNRYDARHLVIGDASLGDLVVGGSFLAGDNASVAAALESVLPVHAEEHGEDQIVLRSR